MCKTAPICVSIIGAVCFFKVLCSFVRCKNKWDFNRETNFLTKLWRFRVFFVIFCKDSLIFYTAFGQGC